MLKGAVTLLSAQPGARKSTFLVGLACGLAAGSLEHLGFDWKGEPLNTLLLNNEDDEDEIDRRVEACCSVNGFDYEEVKKHIYVYKPKNSRPFLAVGRTKTGHLAKHPNFDAQLLAAIDNNKIDVAIADPLASLHSGSENDNVEMNTVFSFFNELCQAKKIPMVIAHHSRKPDVASSNSHAGNPFSSRGASAIHGSVRLMLTLETASDKDGITLGLKKPEEHLNYCRLDTAKDSNSTLGKHTKWYECVGQQVGNPDDGDTAPALKHHRHESQVELLVSELHKCLRNARGLFTADDKGVEGMSMQEAVDTLASVLPGVDDETAQTYVETHFKTPQVRDGVILQLRGKGKKAVLELKTNSETGAA